VNVTKGSDNLITGVNTLQTYFKVMHA